MASKTVAKQRVVLEAIAAATRFHQLLPQALAVQADGPAQQDVEVLERYMRGMRQVKLAEGLRRRAQIACVGDSGGVGFEIDRHRQTHSRLWPETNGPSRDRNGAVRFPYPAGSSSTQISSRLRYLSA
jgi:hypothetical protein